MSDNPVLKNLWKQGAALIAFMTALAGLVKSLREIAEGGKSAALLANDLLLYTGNIALCVFALFVGLVLLLTWIERSEPNSPAASPGAFVIVR